MTPTFLGIIGLCANILGTVLLAFSLGVYINLLQLTINAHELFIASYSDITKPTIRINSADFQMYKDKKRASLFVWIGLVFIILGYSLQIGVYFYVKENSIS